LQLLLVAACLLVLLEWLPFAWLVWSCPCWCTCCCCCCTAAVLLWCLSSASFSRPLLSSSRVASGVVNAWALTRRRAAPLAVVTSTTRLPLGTQPSPASLGHSSDSLNATSGGDTWVALHQHKLV
jgi:hypothetical protein